MRFTMEAASSRSSRHWFALIVGAVLAFGYFGVYDVALAAPEDGEGPHRLLLLSRHGRLTRGAEVRCKGEDGEVLGQVVGLPGEMVVASSEGVYVERKAKDSFGEALDSPGKRSKKSVALAAVAPLPVSMQMAAEPGQVVVAVDASGQPDADEDLPSVPVAFPRKKCLPVALHAALPELGAR